MSVHHIAKQTCTRSPTHILLSTRPFQASKLLAAQVYRIKWWMGHYGAPSAKPQVGWCNNQKFGHLDKGPYRHKLQPKPKIQTVKKTVNKTTGKVSYSGTRDLKTSQP